MLLLNSVQLDAARRAGGVGAAGRVAVALLGEERRGNSCVFGMRLPSGEPMTEGRRRRRRGGVGGGGVELNLGYIPRLPL